jgi:hypothetical protein
VDRVRSPPNPQYINLFPQNFIIQTSIDDSEWTDVLVVDSK